MQLPYEPRRNTLSSVFTFFLILDEAFLGSLGLRLLNLDVPSSVMQGKSLWLNCTLDLEKDDLYSVKWYKNDVEFYRYLPQDSPTAQKYDVPGIFVNLKMSVQGSVFMQNTDLNSEGLYRCEASAESPTFQTVEGEKYMIVYVAPQEGPVIRVNQLKHGIGDFVNVTCTSAPSKPTASLTWYINGKEAPPEYMTEFTVVDHLNGLFSSSRGLFFTVSHHHLRMGRGSINLKCTAVVSQSYSMSSEEIIIGEKIQVTTSSGTSWPLINQFHSHDGPIISGGRQHYVVGDTVNVNCSYSKFRSAPYLQWFLNDKEVSELNVIKYPIEKEYDGQETSTLGLQFRVQSKHFEHGEEMRLKCTATLSEIINMRSDERTVGGNHRSSGLHVSENLGKVLDRNASCRHSEVVFFFVISLLLACAFSH